MPKFTSPKKLRDELFEVMLRPKFKDQIPISKITELQEFVDEKIKFINPSCELTACRDPKDNFLLELAVSANADYLVTNDKDLLVLSPFKGLKILTAREFEQIIAELGI
jgi:hypothetical protein